MSVTCNTDAGDNHSYKNLYEKRQQKTWDIETWMKVIIDIYVYKWYVGVRIGFKWLRTGSSGRKF